MKVFIRSVSERVFDLRIILAIAGLLLSVAMHELVHIMAHIGEIDRISLLSNMHSIVEIALTPTADNDMMLEEALAYAITMIVLVLACRLVSEAHDSLDKKSLRQTIMVKNFQDEYLEKDELKTLEHLSAVLGVK